MKETALYNGVVSAIFFGRYHRKNFILGLIILFGQVEYWND